jgi:hypothetical protein
MNYINPKYYKSDITGKIIKCAQIVHSFLGNGFQEVIYQRALEIEFKKEVLIRIFLVSLLRGFHEGKFENRSGFQIK